MKCEDCKFFVMVGNSIKRHGTLGECHFDPPQLNKGKNFLNKGKWERPPVYSDEFCGMFTSREKLDE